MVIKSAQWDIEISDNGEQDKTPRYVVKCQKKSTNIVVYGTGETELQALYDAQEQMKEHVQKS